MVEWLNRSPPPYHQINNHRFARTNTDFSVVFYCFPLSILIPFYRFQIKFPFFNKTLSNALQKKDEKK